MMEVVFQEYFRTLEGLRAAVNSMPEELNSGKFEIDSISGSLWLLKVTVKAVSVETIECGNHIPKYGVPMPTDLLVNIHECES